MYTIIVSNIWFHIYDAVGHLHHFHLKNNSSIKSRGRLDVLVPHFGEKGLCSPHLSHCIHLKSFSFALFMHNWPPNYKEWLNIHRSTELRSGYWQLSANEGVNHREKQMVSSFLLKIPNAKEKSNVRDMQAIAIGWLNARSAPFGRHLGIWGIGVA